MDDQKVFKEVSKARLSDNVVNQIKRSIIDGVYKPGDKLPSEKELLKRFNVSRGSLREALKSLEQMGFIVVKTGVLGGAYVADMGIRSFSHTLYDFIRMNNVSFDELMEVRKIIEPGMAALAAERRTEDDIKHLEALIEEREKSLKVGKVPIIVTIDWHRVVAEASKNQLLCLLMDTITMRLNDEFKKIALTMEDHLAINNFHKKVLALIKKGNSKASYTAMQEHILDVAKRLKG